MIVSFSGIDSAGKTTQIQMLLDACNKSGVRTKQVWSKARGTPGVIWLKELVRKDKHMDSDEKTEYRNAIFQNQKKQRLLYIASMLDLCWYWGIYYRILGAKYDYLICDRYLWDTYVEIKQDFSYIDIDNSILWRIVKCVAPSPKYSFVFIIPAEVSLERDKQKNAAGIETIDRKKKKIATYMKCVKAGNWSNVMDGMKSKSELHSEVKRTLGIK